MHDPTEMDWFRAALDNAQAEGMTIDDLQAMAQHARTAQEFDTAVNVLTNTMPCPALHQVTVCYNITIK